MCVCADILATKFDRGPKGTNELVGDYRRAQRLKRLPFIDQYTEYSTLVYLETPK